MSTLEITGSIHAMDGTRIGPASFSSFRTTRQSPDSVLEWDGSFVGPGALMGCVGKHEIRLDGKNPFIATITGTHKITKQTMGRFIGHGHPPADIFPDIPPRPVPPDPSPVKVVFSRFGDECDSRYGTLREALQAIAAAVDNNDFAPVSLTMPGSVFGAPPVKFDTLQLYVLADLVREED